MVMLVVVDNDAKHSIQHKVGEEILHKAQLAAPIHVYYPATITLHSAA